MVARNRELERSDAARHALVVAAVDLFTEKGFADTATSEVVNRAGVTRAALYYHFTDKEALFAAAAEAVEARVADRVRAATAGLDGDPAEGLRVSAQAFLDACLEPEVRRLLLREVPSVLGWRWWNGSERTRGPWGLLVERLASAIRDGVLPVQPAEPLAHLLHGALLQAGVVMTSDVRDEDARAAMGTAVRRLLDSLLAGDRP
ncbi:TetR/AcrR family transcriptional regulator [Prauserella endophytica]|uniref:TetR/AcrR family transcriptional regulator n=1 Tax=Prauserella endophytica TaxID=1592324 RepID=A0ABY2S8F7_9PSEU|nr:TetR/AcrR family transcriptional regulator [Prauserella endophytica]TKG71594.1 TetR/AcrR family transcriptional regulator [Prauserella endophytica]